MLTYPQVMVWLVLLTLVSLACVVDHALLSAEQRGWIYYRRRRAKSGSVGIACTPVVDIFQPSRQILIEQQERDRVVLIQAEIGDGENPEG